MASRASRSFTQDLTRSGWELTPQRTRRARPIVLALLLASVAAYAACRVDLDALIGWRGAAPMSAQQPQAEAVVHAGALQQQLEQAQLALGLAQARGRALEREIAAMNERLRTSHEELTFFRSAGRGKN